MTNESIGAPTHAYATATPAERLIYAAEVVLDFQSGIAILPAHRTIKNAPPEDMEWAAEMSRAQQEKGERPRHPDEVIEASLRASEPAKKMDLG